jgi:hypothetical protein
MHKIIPALICTLFLLASAACSKTEQANDNSKIATASNSNSNAAEAKAPPANIVTVNASPAQLTPGGATVAAIEVKIASGYHINANPASAKYLIATALEVEPGDHITVGQPQYPASVTKKFAFSPDPLAVYESEAQIKVQLKAAADAAKGEHTLRAKVRVQPCDDQACYPPRSIETSIPVTVK